MSTTETTRPIADAAQADHLQSRRGGVSRSFRHPRGIYLVAFAQFWERFSFYGILGLLALYLTASAADDGLAWPAEDAAKLVGFYGAATFIAPAFGGWVAAQLWGDQKCIAYGSLLVIAGHVLLAAQALPVLPGSLQLATLYASLALVAIGTGLLKPATSTIIGRFYETNHPKRDEGFTIFMVGIYGGSILSNFVAGTLGEVYGWHYGFGVAAIGMAIGFGVYISLARRLLGDIGAKPDKIAATEDATPRDDQRGVTRIVVFSLFTAVYASFFFQDAGLLNLIVEERVARTIGGFEIPTTWFLSISVTAFVLASPLVTSFWMQRKADVHVKQAVGLGLLGIAFALFWLGLTNTPDTGGVSPLWFLGGYMIFGLADLHIWPVQLNAVTQLAPRKHMSFFVGLWWVAAGVGIFFTGFIAALATRIGGTSNLLLSISLTAFLAAACAYAAGKALRPPQPKHP